MHGHACILHIHNYIHNICMSITMHSVLFFIVYRTVLKISWTTEHSNARSAAKDCPSSMCQLKVSSNHFNYIAANIMLSIALT